MRQAFKKIVNPGRTEYGQVFLKIEVKAKDKDEPDKLCLSISGVEGPLSNGDCKGSAGQNIDALERIKASNSSWSNEVRAELIRVWQNWHLNDMNPGCEHQDGWSAGKKLDVVEYHYGPKWQEAEKKILEGVNTFEEYQELLRHNELRDLSTTYTVHPERVRDQQALDEAVSLGILQVKTKSKLSGWTYPTEHPEGILTKACPTCGHKYGNGWLFLDLPDEVFEFLQSLPDTQLTPAWV